MTSARYRFALALLPALVTFVVISLALVNARALTRATRWVDHTRQVMQRGDALLLRAVDAETGQRGYLVTGDTSYLGPKKGAETAVQGSLGDLRLLTADNPSQQRRLDTLTSELSVRFAILDRGIALRLRGRSNDPLADGTLLREGRNHMDRIRQLIGDVEASEQGLLANRRADETRQARIATAVLILGGVLAVIVALLVNLFLTRIITERELMTRELGAQLEDLVAIKRETAERGPRDA